jgi:hypothetical protein
MSKSYTFYIYIVDGNGSTLYSYGLYTITY